MQTRKVISTRAYATKCFTLVNTKLQGKNLCIDKKVFSITFFMLVAPKYIATTMNLIAIKKVDFSIFYYSKRFDSIGSTVISNFKM